MNYKADIPQIAALRHEVEQSVGRVMKTHADFLVLVSEIEQRLREHMSETTLERVWGYSTRGYDTVSGRTLDVLSRMVGVDGWDAFCAKLRDEARVESEFFVADAVLSSSLEVGARVRIGWQPDRVCVVRYLGDNRFVAESTENSTMQPGDKFSCMQFQKGRELYLDMFQRADDDGEPDVNARYVVGQRNGLTVVEVIR